jgi:hypothetical protein
MLRRAGQAGRRLGRLLHHPMRLIGTVFLVLLIGLGAASWRLSRGPVELPFLAARIGAAASKLQPGADIAIGHAWLAWEGFHSGGAPLDLRLSDIALRTRKGVVAATISRLRITLAPVALLRGEIAPIMVIARRTTIAIRPQPHRRTIRTLREEATRLAQALRPAPASRNRLDLDRLRLIRIIHADIILDDPQAGLHLTAPDSSVTLRRAADGAIMAQARALFHQATGGAAATGGVMPVTMTYHAVAGHGLARAVIGPGRLPKLLPQVKALAALRLPVTIDAALPFGQDHRPGALALRVALGQGSIAVAQGLVPVANANFTLAVNSRKAWLTQGLIRLGGMGKTPAPVITVTGKVDGSGMLNGVLDASADQVEAAALPLYWPEGLAAKTRKFVLTRISGGSASAGRFHFGLSWNEATGKVRLDRLDGSFNARGVVFRWLKGMPPMTGLAGTLHFPDRSHLRIHADHGAVGGIAISKGLVVISGIARKDQAVVITGALAGPVRRAVAVLAAPRPGAASHSAILPVHRAQLRDVRGMAGATIRLDLPIKPHLTLKDMHLAALVHLTGFGLALPLGRLALHDGDVRVTAGFREASMTGSGMIGGQPAQFSGRMSRAGGQPFTFQLATRLDRAMLTDAGYAMPAGAQGTAPVKLNIAGTPQAADAALHADLTRIAFAVPALDWSKPAGAPGQASLALTLRGGRTTIRSLAASAPGLAIAAQGGSGSIMVSALDIGRSRATGKITPPSRPGAPWLIALAGPVLDLSGAIAQSSRGSQAKQTQGRAVPVPWRLRGAFDRLMLRRQDAGTVTALHLRAEGTGLRLAALRATALLAGSHHLELGVLPARTGRRIRLTAGDGGALLRGAGIADTVAGGRLDLVADDAGGTLTGRATMADFRLRHAPLIGKVLQGLTLYGLAEATSGPGLAFSRLVAPFSLTHHVLTIHDGRAFSASLGVTMAGQADFARKDYNLGGTIVPAYALNSLPGRIPLLGRLFRAGKGSGLFSARYTVDGPFAAPHIMVNPLAALAPGVFARIFGNGPPDHAAVSVKKQP